MTKRQCTGISWRGVRHSQADIVTAASKLGYVLEFRTRDGIAKAMPWYLNNLPPARLIFSTDTSQTLTDTKNTFAFLNLLSAWVRECPRLRTFQFLKD